MDKGRISRYLFYFRKNVHFNILSDFQPKKMRPVRPSSKPGAKFIRLFEIQLFPVEPLHLQGFSCTVHLLEPQQARAKDQ